MTFIDMLQGAERQNRSLLCVGLDPEPARFPAHLQGDASRIYDFGRLDVYTSKLFKISYRGGCPGTISQFFMFSKL